MKTNTFKTLRGARSAGTLRNVPDGTCIFYTREGVFVLGTRPESSTWRLVAEMRGGAWIEL